MVSRGQLPPVGDEVGIELLAVESRDRENAKERYDHKEDAEPRPRTPTVIHGGIWCCNMQAAKGQSTPKLGGYGGP
jgi:hypothetical protein